jgi:hypothetical protein
MVEIRGHGAKKKFVMPGPSAVLRINSGRHPGFEKLYNCLDSAVRRNDGNKSRFPIDESAPWGSDVLVN